MAGCPKKRGTPVAPCETDEDCRIEGAVCIKGACYKGGDPDPDADATDAASPEESPDPVDDRFERAIITWTDPALNKVSRALVARDGTAKVQVLTDVWAPQHGTELCGEEGSQTAFALRERGLVVSSYGAWQVVESNRPALCACWSCLAIAGNDGAPKPILLDDGGVMRSTGRWAVSNGGAFVVTTGQLIVDDPGDPPSSGTGFTVHLQQAFGEPWTSENRSPGDAGALVYFDEPDISPDGARLLFSCRSSLVHDTMPPGEGQSAICRMRIFGTPEFEVVFDDRAAPAGLGAGLVRRPVHGPEGAVYFEASWLGHPNVWRWHPEEGISALGEDPESQPEAAPCVLPDGRIVSWALDADAHRVVLRSGRFGTPETLDAQPPSAVIWPIGCGLID